MSFFKTNDVASWSAPLYKVKAIKTEVKHEDSDEEYVDNAPNSKGKGRRVVNTSQNASTFVTGNSSNNKSSTKKDVLHNKVTADRVTKNNNMTTRSKGSHTITLPLRPLASKPVQGPVTPHHVTPIVNAPAAAPTRPPTSTRAPRPPPQRQYDTSGNPIPLPNVRWNEPMMINVLFGVLEAANDYPGLDPHHFFNKVGKIMTSDPKRPITGNAIIQRLTKLKNFRLAAATPLLGGDTIADLVDFSQTHQRGKETIGVYTKKDLGVAVALTPPLSAGAGHPMATTSWEEEDGDDEEEEEVEEEFVGGGESAVGFLSPAEAMAAAYPEQASFEMDSLWATQNEAAQVAAIPWGWTPAVSSSAGSYDPQHYAWGFNPEQEMAWAAEVQGGLHTNQDSSFTGFE